ncbi:MAG: hypothetical protein GC168_09290 [Candidatus Hydrogenedens sp.]|nr:hypothetical protein [Candidatus Hydrogenedens sp.]
MSATHITFFAGVGLQMAAALITIIAYARRGANDAPVYNLARYVSIAGAASLVVLFTLRWLAFGLIPLTSGVESLALVVLMVAVNAAVITANPSRRTLAVVYFPALGALSIVALLLGTADLDVAPKQLSPLLLLLHVVPAFMAYALFFVAMLTASVYLFQTRRLKERRTTGIFQQLPSLANLDSVLFGLIRTGYPLFILTLVLGFYWAWVDRELLGRLWWASPKIVLSFCMVVLYASCYHGRSRGSLRGPKLAMLLAAGFGLLMSAYLLLELSTLTNYNFWGDVQ